MPQQMVTQIAILVSQFMKLMRYREEKGKLGYLGKLAYLPSIPMLETFLCVCAVSLIHSPLA